MNKMEKCSRYKARSDGEQMFSCGELELSSSSVLYGGNEKLQYV